MVEFILKFIFGMFLYWFGFFIGYHLTSRILTKSNRKHGKWVYDFTLAGSKFYNCSICGRQETLLAKEEMTEYFPYCAQCGSIMDGVENDIR